MGRLVAEKKKVRDAFKHSFIYIKSQLQTGAADRFLGGQGAHLRQASPGVLEHFSAWTGRPPQRRNGALIMPTVNN